MPPDYHRTNINLYLADVEWLQRRYGYGWTEHVREIVHEYIRNQTDVSVIRSLIKGDPGNE